MTKLSTILDQIDAGTMLLPEFQRGYVWNRDQVRGLMRSLYKGFPVGSLMVWETSGAPAVRGSMATGDGSKRLLLDGQQRVTSLYGIICGRPPAFFDGDPATFTGLRFHVDHEVFEFYAPAKMRDDPLWIDVTELFTGGPAGQFAKLTRDGGDMERFPLHAERLTRLHALRDREFHEEKITGSDKTIDLVVEIFNKVNSGGTKLSKGDLALAKICADWGEARAEMRTALEGWRRAGYHFSLDWLLRNINAVATGRAPFDALDDVSPEGFANALTSAIRHINGVLDIVSGRLGLDHDRVLMGRYAMPVVSRYLHLNGGRFLDATQRDRMLFWYVQSGLWGRFAGSTETVLTQDYETLARGGIEALTHSLARWRGGNLTIDAQDFEGFGRGSRFYPLLYLLTRVRGARDFGSGLELKSEMLGHLASLQVHHIFPKALLYKHGYVRAEVNAVANFCFLTQRTNLAIGKRRPEDYFAETRDKHPDALESQWIPTDESLWRIDRYRDFLAARRELLAAAANGFLSELRDGTRPLGEPLRPVVMIDQADTDDARSRQVQDLVTELTAAGCAEPVLDVEIADPTTGLAVAAAEAFWPDGLQPGLGSPVVLELDSDSDLSRLEELGYEVFTSVDALRGFVARRNQEAAGGESEDTIEDDERQGADSAAFDRAMRELHDTARREAHYPANHFRTMLSEHGGLATARRLLATSVVSDGFTALWERGRLDLTVEALIVRPEYSGLFTEEELAKAHDRLKQFGYLSTR